MDETQILKECFERSEDGWKKFLETYSRLIYGAVISTFRRKAMQASREETEEIFCAFIAHLVEGDFKVLRRFEGLRGCTLASWIKMLTVHFTIDTIRKQHKKQSREIPVEDIVAESLSSDADNPETEFSKQEVRSLLRECAEKLPAKERLFLRLYYEDGVPVERAARLLRITESGAYAMKNRIVASLRSRLKSGSAERK